MKEFIIYALGSFIISLVVFLCAILISRITTNKSKEENHLIPLSENRLAFSNILFGAIISIGSAFLSAGISLLIGIFPIFEELVMKPNPNFFSSYLNMINYIIYGGLILIVIGVASSYVTIFKKSKTPQYKYGKNLTVISTQSFVTPINNYKVHFGLGFFVLLLALSVYYFPTLNDHNAVQTWTGFDIIYDKNMNLNNIKVEIIALENHQVLHIYYSVDQIKGEKPLLMFVIPYLVTMTNTEESLNFTIPGDWETHYIPEIKSTVMSKIFDCTGIEKYCNDQLNMYFEFQEPIDSKQYFIHSIDIPFQANSHYALIEKQNEIIIPPYEYTHSWQTDGESLLKVSVLDDSTEYNPIPDGYLEPRKYNETGVSNSVMVWKIPDHSITFHLDYVNPDERRIYDSLNAIGLVLIGTSSGILILATAEYAAQRKPAK